LTDQPSNQMPKRPTAFGGKINKYKDRAPSTMHKGKQPPLKRQEQEQKQDENQSQDQKQKQDENQNVLSSKWKMASPTRAPFEWSSVWRRRSPFVFLFSSFFSSACVCACVCGEHFEPSIYDIKYDLALCTAQTKMHLQKAYKSRLHFSTNSHSRFEL